MSLGTPARAASLSPLCAALVSVMLFGCGATPARSTLPTAGPSESVHMEALRITNRGEENGFDFSAYDAEMLFNHATDLLNRQACLEAVPFYDRLADEFPDSRYASAALYNAGFCLHDMGELEPAADHYARLIETYPQSQDVRHASLQLSQLYVRLERFEAGLTLADQLLQRDDLSVDERVEAMARRAQNLVGLARLDEAARQARSTITYYRSRPEEERVRDEFFVAAANYVLAETMRMRSEQIAIPVGNVDVQRAALEQRAQLLLNAQREYFNAIRHTNAYWAGASGYQIGAMYDAFWEAIMHAPTPPPSSPLPDTEDAEQIYEAEYRKELARLVKPLVRHSIRYWELTLMMVERTGVESDWSERIRADLARARTRLLDQPEGLGGISKSGDEAPRASAGSHSAVQ